MGLPSPPIDSSGGPPTARDVVLDDSCSPTSHDNTDTSAVTRPSVAAVTHPVADRGATYAETAEENRENVFQVVSNEKASKKKRQLVVGRSTANTVSKGVVKKAVVCVNRVDPAVTTDVVSNFLRDNGVHVYSCYTVKNKRYAQESGEGSQSTAELAKETNFISMRLCVSYSCKRGEWMPIRTEPADGGILKRG